MENRQLVRGAGVLMAISSLPSAYGIGTMGKAAYDFVDMLVDLKQRYWQILPVGPTSFGNSPYQPISAFAGNEYLIDLEALVANRLLSYEEIRNYEWGNNSQDIDYSSIYLNRVKVLRLAFERFDCSNGQFEQFVRDNNEWLEDYALFRALKQYHEGREWTSWEEEYRNRDKQALKKISHELKNEIEFYRFCQYLFYSQWTGLREYANSKGLQIIGDIPFYVAHDSADVWANRHFFLLDERGNATLVSAVPPDAFSATGQIWGNPIYNWEELDNDGFNWWKKRAAQAAKMYNIIKLDHFIAIVKYYAVSAKSSSTAKGKWHKGPGKKLIEIIQKVVGDRGLIIDDAGPKTFVPGVKKMVEKSGIPGCKILLFGIEAGADSDNLPHNITSSNVVIYTTTHDTETAAGYVRDRDIGELAYLCDYSGQSKKDQLADSIVRIAYASSADVVIVPMQDILGLGNEARMNSPATVGGNWQWRISQNVLTEDRCNWIRKLAYIYRR